jgi:hypothetical protein
LKDAEQGVWVVSERRQVDRRGNWKGAGTRKGKRGKNEVAEKKAEHNSVK